MVMVSVESGLETRNVVVTSGAGLKFALPAWFAAIVTFPGPVIVTVRFVEILAGPLLIRRTTGNAEEALGADMTNGTAPTNFGSIVAKALIV
jgi:hypothetical protein